MRDVPSVQAHAAFVLYDRRKEGRCYSDGPAGQELPGCGRCKGTSLCLGLCHSAHPAMLPIPMLCTYVCYAMYCLLSVRLAGGDVTRSGEEREVRRHNTDTVAACKRGNTRRQTREQAPDARPTLFVSSALQTVNVPLHGLPLGLARRQEVADVVLFSVC